MTIYSTQTIGNLQPLNAIIDRVVQCTSPEKIILFGSYARSSKKAPNDIDLWVIKSGIENRRRLAQQIYQY